ncbi:hypothetical protein pb186bvf_015022 [Paramecium bursaria]
MIFLFVILLLILIRHYQFTKNEKIYQLLQKMNIMNIQQVMQISKFAALLAISLRSSFFVYKLYRRYQLSKPLQLQLEYDFQIVWDDLIYDEHNITPQTIKDVFDHALKVGSKGLITIAQYYQNKRRFYGWKKNSYCYSLVLQEVNKKINYSREVIEQILTFKGYNYWIFADTVIQGMRDNQQILQLNLDFDFLVIQKYSECQEQLNEEGIFYYIQKFLDLLNKNKEEIQQIKDMIYRHNYYRFQSILNSSYVRDLWFQQFSFEYTAFLDSIKSYKEHSPNNQVNKRADEFFLQLEKIFA